MQDWYQSCIKAIEVRNKLLADHAKVTILVPTRVRFVGYGWEGRAYVKTFRQLGLADEHWEIPRHGFETIGQVAYGLGLLDRFDTVVFVSTWLHNPRVRWLCGKQDKARVRHTSAFGMPRPREAITDLIMIPGMPLIDLFGLREAFQKRVTQRRRTGKL